MNLKKSLERLKWRFGNNTNFKPNMNDVNALNEVIEYVDKKERQQLSDNQLFGKLYIYLYGEFVNYYRSNTLDPIPQKELHKLLDKDPRELIEDLKDKLNQLELEHSIKTKSTYTPVEYDEVSDNLRVMVNAALNTYK
ncbi:MAG: hypothetical protein AAF348_18750 [Bacteroidota bacterium]